MPKTSKDSGLSNADELTKLQRNVKLWASNRAFDSDECILNANCKINKDQLNSCKIVFWAGGSEEISTSDVLEFIRNGGGFVYCMTPWGWLEGNPSKKLKDMPYWDVLTSVGVCYTDDYIHEDNDTKAFPIAKNKASGAHLLECLQSTAGNFDDILKKISMLEGIQYLPDAKKNSLKDDVTQHWKICTDKLQSTYPNGKIETKTKEEWGMLKLWQLCSELSPCCGIKAPFIEIFPGDFKDAPTLIDSSELTFKSEREDIYPTGCYAPAGTEVTVQVLSGNDKADWKLIIGAHTYKPDDDLLRRWPRISKKFVLDQQGRAEYKVVSYFGGSIYFLSSNNGESVITARLCNIVEAPIFDSEINGKNVWKTKRDAPGLWADMRGELVTITIPAESVRGIDDPSRSHENIR